jgi:hypothetical protein
MLSRHPALFLPRHFRHRKRLSPQTSGHALRLDSGIKPQYRIRLAIAERNKTDARSLKNGRKDHAQYAIVASARAIGGCAYT